jgi:hypothetical protein
VERVPELPVGKLEPLLQALSEPLRLNQNQ